MGNAAAVLESPPLALPINLPERWPRIGRIGCEVLGCIGARAVDIWTYAT